MFLCVSERRKTSQTSCSAEKKFHCGELLLGSFNWCFSRYSQRVQCTPHRERCTHQQCSYVCVVLGTYLFCGVLQPKLCYNDLDKENYREAEVKTSIIIIYIRCGIGIILREGDGCEIEPIVYNATNQTETSTRNGGGGNHVCYVMRVCYDESSSLSSATVMRDPKGWKCSFLSITLIWI